MNTSRTTAPTPELELFLALARAYATATRRFDGRLGAWHGIGFADFAILLQLHRAPERQLRRVDLAEQLGLTASAVTRALIPLEKIGLVSRKADPNDARVSYATMTAAGRRVLEEALESAAAISREIVGEDAALVPDCAAFLAGMAGGEPQRPPARSRAR